MVTRIAAVQYSPGPDVSANLETVERLLERASEANCDLVVLPEIFAAPFVPSSIDGEYFNYAETLEGPSNSLVARVSKDRNMSIVSPIFEKTDVDGVYYNTACVFHDGVMLGRYRKSHLPFSNGFPEKFYFRAGNREPDVIRCGVIALGTIICYERHFPELPRIAALKGANVLAVPVAAASAPTKAIFQTELRAHAIANGMYVVCANRIGVERDKNYYGASAVYAPTGDIIAEATDSGAEVVVADVELSTVAEARRRLPFLRDRRTEIFGRLVEPELSNEYTATGAV